MHALKPGLKSALKSVRPDAKGRITLGPLAKGISRFDVYKDQHNRIILEPFVEIPTSKLKEAKDWERSEEDKAWAHLQQDQ